MNTKSKYFIPIDSLHDELFHIIDNFKDTLILNIESEISAISIWFLDNHDVMFKSEQVKVKDYIGELTIYSEYMRKKYANLKIEKLEKININIKIQKNSIDNLIKTINNRRKIYFRDINDNNLEYIR